MKHQWDVDLRTHRWSFGAAIADVEFVVADCIAPDAPNGVPYTVDVCDAALIHGFKQKIADAAAIPFEKNKRYATDAEKREAMQSVVDRLNNGEWNATLGGPKKAKPVIVDALVAAIVALRGRTEAATRAFVESKSEEVRFGLAMGDEFRLEYALQCVKLAGPGRALDAELADELDNIE